MFAAFQVEAHRISCESKIDRAIQIQLLPAASYRFDSGDLVRVYRGRTQRSEVSFKITGLVERPVCNTDEEKVTRFPCFAIIHTPRAPVIPKNSGPSW